MKKNNTVAVPNNFKFVYKDDSKDIIYRAKKRHDGKFEVTWVLDDEKDKQLYKRTLVEMLLNSGIWVIVHDV